MWRAGGQTLRARRAVNFRTRSGIIWCLVWAAATAWGAQTPAPASAHDGALRVGVAPAMPRGAQPLAAVASSRSLQLTVVLKPSRPAALAAYARAVSNPASPSFRHYLRPAQFAQRFAPAPASEAAVAASLRARGLTPGPTSPNGLAIPVRATVATVERAFSLSLADVRLANGRVAVINTQAPAIDAGVAGLIQAVVGLTSLDHPEPAGQPGPAGALGGPDRLVTRDSRAHVVTGGPQPCAAAQSAAGNQSAYTADQIASGYEFPGLYAHHDEGQGVTIAVYELESDDPSDIAAYQACYGTHSTVSYVPVDGGAGTGPGSGEAALDIEQLIGLAPRAHILVYQAPNSNSGAPGAGPYDAYSAIVNQDRAAVVTTSWGQCESVEGQTDAAAENVLFQEAATQGQTIFSAAGDEGSEDCDQPPPSVPNTQLAVDDPASQPFVTGVGGTSIKSLGPPATETAWNNGGNLGALIGIEPGAGGGGISSLWAMPSYQSTASAHLNVVQSDSSGSPCHVSGDCREVPDVSADADPYSGYLIYYNGSGLEPTSPSGWQGTGGTSGAAPLWAAVTALADASSACGGVSVGFINPALYRLAGTSQAAYLNDITSGNNDFTGTQGGRYPAGPGYDLATGLGSPKAAALAAALCQQGLRLANPGSRRTYKGSAVNLGVKVSGGAGSSLHLSVHGLPPGLSLRASSHRISGRPRRLGVFHVTLKATDSISGTRTVRFTWTIVRKRKR